MRTSGRETLFVAVSGTLTDVPIQTAVARLTAGLDLPLPVSILGDAQRKVTLSYKNRPLQLVLLDLERLAGVTLEGPWLPRLPDGRRFSFAAQGRAGKLAMLIYAVRGRPLEIPDDKAEKRVRLNLIDVTIEQAAQALLRALQ